MNVGISFNVIYRFPVAATPKDVAKGKGASSAAAQHRDVVGSALFHRRIKTFLFARKDPGLIRQMPILQMIEKDSTLDRSITTCKPVDFCLSCLGMLTIQ